jgi:hypothetical protein
MCFHLVPFHVRGYAPCLRILMASKRPTPGKQWFVRSGAGGWKGEEVLKGMRTWRKSVQEACTQAGEDRAHAKVGPS